MKKYSILLSAAFAIFALVSCQKVADVKNNLVQEGSVPFELKADVSNPFTKTSFNESTLAVDWENGDIIYAVTTDAEWGQPYSSDNPGATIAEFTYSNATGKFSTDKTISDGNHTFNFLYSNGAQKSYHRGASTTFQLYTNQSYDVSNPTANIKAYDALAGQVAATTPTSFVDVDMSHLFTLMKVTIKNKTGNDLTASKLEVTATGAYLWGIFNVTFGATPSVSYSKNGGSTIAVNIANGAIANNGTIDVYFVMAPLSSYTGNITFKVTDSADNMYSNTNTISSALTLAAGSLNSATHTLTTPDAPDPGTTITKTMNEIVSANNYTVSSGQNVTCYTSFALDGNITVSTTGTANCGSFWGTTTKDWRLYQNKSGNIIISAGTGKKLLKVTITYNASNGGVLKDGGVTIASAAEQDLSASEVTSVTYTVGNSGTATNGQVKVTQISVTYDDI